MKKLMKTTLLSLTLAACSIASAAAFHAQNATASAEETSPATNLLLPSSYEQYLHLSAPTDVAVTEDYTAISDGNIIYVYNRDDGVYRKYEHSLNTDPLKNNVTKLQFDDAGNLYFLDATYLYVLDPDTLDEETPTVTDTKFPCTTFYLHKNMLYFTDTKASTTQLSQLDLDLYDVDVTHAVTLKSDLLGKPTLTVYNDELYYTSSNNLKKITLETGDTGTVAIFDEFPELASIRIVDGIFCCTNNAQTFYAYDLSDLSKAITITDKKIVPLNKTAGSFSALTVFDTGIYAVDGNTIRHYDVTEQAFTDYEIGNQSSSAHRLNNAVESYFTGSLLLIADDGNGRISVYDTQNDVFLDCVPNALQTSYLVSDGQTVLVANERNATVYSLRQKDYGALLAQYDDFNGKVVGAASVYGAYYLVSDNYCHYRLATDENGKWAEEEIQRPATRMPSLLTSDAYGNLYVASGSKIYRYTEAQFLTVDEDGEEVYSGLSTLTQKLLVDYDGNFYALIENQLFKLGEDTAYDLNTPLVYTNTANIRSFAFGIEDNKAYVLYAENYIAETEILGLPTVKTIAVNDADEIIFAETSAEFSVVETQPNALTIYFEISALQGAEHFPYQAYERRVQPFTALKIGETELHNALAIFNGDTHEYQTCLVLKSQCAELPTEDYRSDCEPETFGYLTNAVSLYKFPYLTSLLTVSRLEAGAKVQLLGKIDKLDHPYYQVSYTDENGVTQTGFIPQTYVTSFNGAPPVPETETYGSTENNNDSIFRLCYLILGAGVICILADILLLVKRKDDEDDDE